MDTPGITRTARADSLGVRGLGCMDLELDILVSDDQVLGQVDQGFRLAMWALQGGRVAIAAQALGIGRAALDEAIAYAKQREQFGQPIANYQAIQWMLADMATELAAARMLTLKAAAAKETQERSTVEASMAKLAASEAAHKAADKAIAVRILRQRLGSEFKPVYFGDDLTDEDDAIQVQRGPPCGFAVLDDPRAGGARDHPEPCAAVPVLVPATARAARNGGGGDHGHAVLLVRIAVHALRRHRVAGLSEHLERIHRHPPPRGLSGGRRACSPRAAPCPSTYGAGDIGPSSSCCGCTSAASCCSGC